MTDMFMGFTAKELLEVRYVLGTRCLGTGQLQEYVRGLEHRVAKLERTLAAMLKPETHVSAG